MFQNKPEAPAVVLGLFETGLSIMRSLERQGIPVFALDTKKICGWYSRFAKKRICPDPQKEEARFIEFLKDLAFSFPSPAVLYLTADNYLCPIAKYREELREWYIINIPEETLLQRIKDKYSQYHLAKDSGIPVPKTLPLSTNSELEQISESFTFPVLLKAQEVLSWREVFGPTTKGFIADNQDALQKTWSQIKDKGVSVIAQEFIRGPNTNHWKYCCYISSKGNLLCSFTLRKLRQQPVHCGVGSYVESRLNDQISKLGQSFFEAIGYHGVGSAEFKQDADSGEFKLIELNPRYWQQCALATACGMDFALIQYLDAQGNSQAPSEHFREGVHWVNVHRDFESFRDCSSKGKLDFSAWLGSLKRPLIVSDFAWDDPLPFLYQLQLKRHFLSIPKYLNKISCRI